MTYISSDIISEWRTIAQGLSSTSELGVACRLSFQNSIIATGFITSDSIGKKQAFMPSYGGKSSLQLRPGYEYSNIPTGVGLIQSENSKTIPARVYGANKEFSDISTNAGQSKNIYKMICDKAYLPDLLRCSDAILNYGFAEKEVRTALMMPPVPYGLGGFSQIKSYWVEA
jgi:hypothetical protein